MYLKKETEFILKNIAPRHTHTYFPAQMVSLVNLTNKKDIIPILHLFFSENKRGGNTYQFILQ